MSAEMDSNIKNPRLNKNTRLPELAPITLRMPISFSLVSVVNTTMPNKPIEAIDMAKKAKNPMYDLDHGRKFAYT